MRYLLVGLCVSLLGPPQLLAQVSVSDSDKENVSPYAERDAQLDRMSNLSWSEAITNAARASEEATYAHQPNDLPVWWEQIARDDQGWAHAVINASDIPSGYDPYWADGMAMDKDHSFYSRLPQYLESINESEPYFADNAWLVHQASEPCNCSAKFPKTRWLSFIQPEKWNKWGKIIEDTTWWGLWETEFEPFIEPTPWGKLVETEHSLKLIEPCCWDGQRRKWRGPDK